MGLQTTIIDLLRSSAEKKAMGPMRYRRSQSGHAIADDANYASQQALAKLLRTPGKTETMTDRQIRQAEESTN